MPISRFTWDPAKNRANSAKHGVTFETASEIFNDRTVELPDERFDYGEDRWIAVGLAGGRELTVVYTVTDNDQIRIISARGATSKERRFYWTNASR